MSSLDLVVLLLPRHGGASDVSRAPGAAATATATGSAGAYASRYTKAIRG